MADPIPEDIMREARAAADEHDRRMRKLYLAHTDDRRAAMIDIVATALLARDQRAAEIARSLPGWMQPRDVATAILTYDRPTLKENGNG